MYCSAQLSRGGTSAKSDSTTSLINHLKSKHIEKHAEYEKDTAGKRKLESHSPGLSASTSTPSVAAVFEKAKKFASDSAKAKGITTKVMEFIG